MNILSLLVFFAFIVYLYLGIYTYRLDPKSKLNRIFSLACIDFAIWAFVYTFFYSASDKETAWFWYKISSVGWCFFPGLVLHFFITLTEKENVLKKWWIYLVLYLPGTAFIYRALTGTLLVIGFVYKGLGWCEIASSNSIWFWSYTLYYSSFIMTSLILIFQWGMKAKNNRKKKQAMVILLTAFPTLVMSTVTDTILPALKIYAMPSVASILILLWIFGIWYAIVRYKLMILTPSIAVEDIVSKMSDLLVLVNQDGNIIKLNRRTIELLEYEESELIGKPLDTIFNEKEFVKDEFEKNKHNLHHTFSFELNLKTKNNLSIPLNVSCSAIKDTGDNLIGMAIVGQDLRQMKQLQQEIAERKRAEARLQQMAFFDTLTGLSNRTLFFDRLNHLIAISKRNNNMFALLFLDLDGFKHINDTFGHDIGDLLIKETAGRLAECARESDTVARMGGDEFAIILTNIPNKSEAQTIAERIIASLTKPFNLKRTECYISTSIGISLYPADGNDMDTLLKKADIAMYSVKEMGKNSYAFYKE